jgi:hypothetical protein
MRKHFAVFVICVAAICAHIGTASVQASDYYCSNYCTGSVSCDDMCIADSGGVSSTCGEQGGPTAVPPTCSGFCGDGLCNGTIHESNPETFLSCPEDCHTFVCGNNSCEPDAGENTVSCPSDCYCGDHVCDQTYETGNPWFCNEDCFTWVDASGCTAGCDPNDVASCGLGDMYCQTDCSCQSASFDMCARNEDCWSLTGYDTYCDTTSYWVNVCRGR